MSFYMLISLNILIVFNLLNLSIQDSFLFPDYIYYSSPRFNLKNSNATFVSARIVANTGDEENSLETLGKTMMIVCQADKINRKAASVSFDGIMNIAFKNYYGPISSGQEAILDLLANSLYYKNNNSRLNTEEGLNVAGFMGISDFGTTKINSLATNSYGIPSLTIGDASRSNPDNDFIGLIPPEEFIFFDLLNTQDYNSFDAVLQICQHFNWSIVGNIYEGNSYGYTRQRNVLTYSGNYSSPIFTCNYILPEFRGNKTGIMKVLDNYCSCINYRAKIQVSLLWMSTSLSTDVISYLRKNCASAKQWTFLVTNDIQSVISYSNDYNKIFDGTLLLRNNGPWDIQGYISECQSESSPAAKEAVQDLIGSYYKLAYNCFQARNSSTSPEFYEKCSEIISNRRNACECTGEEFGQDQYSSKYFFAADMVSAWAYAINLLQNNCSFLNAKAQNLSESLKVHYEAVDYCSLTTYAPNQIGFAMRFINFTGYTGEIYFAEEIMKRAVKSYFLYSVNGSLYNEVLVGQLSYQNYTINNSLITWINGEIPTSQIEVQNPDLSYAVVDVFFGIAIFEIIIFAIVMVWYVINFDDPVIRRSAPFVTLSILIGLFFISLSQLIFSLQKTDAICTLVLFFFHFGIMILITGLIVKNFRIYKIFSNKKALPVLMPESNLLWAMVGFTSIYMGIIVIFVCVFGYDAVIKTSSYTRLYSYAECSIPNSTWNTIFKFLLLIPILLILIANIILAWLTRNVTSDYREANSLAALTCIIFAAFILFIPLGLTFGDEVDSEIFRYVLHVEFMTIVIISSFLILFVPKIVAVYSKKEDKRVSTIIIE